MHGKAAVRFYYAPDSSLCQVAFPDFFPAAGSSCRACGECSREIRIPMVAPAASVPAKYEFRWSPLRGAFPRNTNSDGRNSISLYICYVDIRF